MDIFKRIANWFKPVEKRSMDADIVRTLLGESQDDSGANVTPDTALTFSAVWACVRVLSESIGMLPLFLYRRLGADGRERATDAPLYSVLHDQPNPDMTSVTYRETCMVHLCTWGNSYSEIRRDGAGRVRELWPLDPSQMNVDRNQAGELVYHYWDRGQRTTFPRDKIFHVLGLGTDGLVGLNQVDIARQEIGLGLTLNQHGARTFKNGARPGLVLEHPGHLGTDAEKTLRASFDATYGGAINAGKTAILEEGMKLSTFGFPNESAQFLQSRQFQIEEVARMYRVPPHLIGDLERATFSNIEHQSLEFVTYSLGPWMTRIEEAVSAQLMNPTERQIYFAEFLADALLRGDIGSRYTAYATARQNGWMNANEIRQRENLNPFAGGDTYLVPMNMVPADEAGATTASSGAGAPVSARRESPSARESPSSPTLPPEGEGRAAEERNYRSVQARQRLGHAYRRMFSDVMERVLRREQADVRKAAARWLAERSDEHPHEQRDAAHFDSWLTSFYAEHREFVKKNVTPVYGSFRDAVGTMAQDEVNALGTAGAEQDMTRELDKFTTAYVEDFALRHSNISESKVRTAVQRAVDAGTSPADAVDEELDKWSEPDTSRANDTARWESVRFGNAIAATVFALAGRQLLRWYAFGKSCPYCQSLNGKTVGIKETFLDPSQPLTVEGIAKALTVGSKVHHPPAHDGCDCGIGAA